MTKIQKYTLQIDEEQTITIFRYPTSKSCMEAFFERDIDKVKICKGYDDEGNPWKCTSDEFLKYIRKNGCWAFIDLDNTIHIWHRKNTSIEKLVELLAHELGHTQRPYKYDLKEEEIKAGKYSHTARYAYQNTT